jgi:tetratricopeptide (TPR) repeat protein
MRRTLLAVLAVLAWAAGAEANLMDTWQEVQEHLAAGDAGAAEQTLQILQDQATELEVQRMPAFAAALVAWAEAHPGAEGEALVRVARQLDPQYPSSYFLEARWLRARGSSMAALQAQLAGWAALVRYEPTRPAVLAWIALAAVSALGLALASLMLATLLRHVRSLLHDLRSLGGVLFRPANAWVFAVVVLLLPIFGGLGPVWLGAYLFAASWIYLSARLRVWAVAACLVMIFVVPAVGSIHHRLVQPPPLSDRLATALVERQMDLGTLREMAELEATMAETAPYHLLLGELLRMHGEPGLAKVEFQKAVVADPDEARALIFVGALALEEGDAQLAVQVLNSALEVDPDNPFAYHNLSLAFDLIRRFQEGDQARTRARQYAGPDSPEQGLRGLDPRIRFPRLGRRDVADFAAEMDSRQELAAVEPRGAADGPRPRFETLSLVFAFALVLGLVLLVVRARWFGPARECTKCGKIYRLESGFGESSVYCPQCVSVFLKRDVVSIEQQTAKLHHIRNWERMSAAGRRVAGLLFPGSPYLLADRAIRAVLFAFVCIALLGGGMLWLPMFAPMIEPLASFTTLRVVMLALGALMVLRSATMSWDRR